jgi:hypothetical protein
MLSSQDRNLNSEKWDETAILGSLQMGNKTFMREQAEKYHFWRN